jgi:hypothetical protein
LWRLRIAGLSLAFSLVLFVLFVKAYTLVAG